LQAFDLKTVDMQYHVYQLDLGQQTEVMEGDGEELPAASHWILPSAEFHSLWENLIHDSTIKENVYL
jgi:pachytene checkpoint protein 2